MTTPKHLQRTCHRCNAAPATPTTIYCKACKKLVLDELKSSGYLQPEPASRNYRDRDAKENEYETRRGRD